MGKRLILVEDEVTLARAVARLLRRHGYDVYLAGTCDEARRAPSTFSLGIFDIDLPDGDGIDLAKELSKLGVVRRVVFFSGTAEATQQAGARKIGPLVEKSRGFPDLLAVIELALASQHAKVSGAEDISVGGSSRAAAVWDSRQRELAQELISRDPGPAPFRARDPIHRRDPR